MKTLPDTGLQVGTLPALPQKRRWGRIIAIGIAIVVVLAGAVGAVFYKYVSGKLDSGDLELQNIAAKDPGGAVNILVIGSDTRTGLDKREQSLPAFYRTDGKRSDTIMLIHLFGDKKHAVVMSFPRDLRVSVPGVGMSKINAAYNLGPDNVIKTVGQYTGLKIHHYVEVNFVSFRRIVDSLGGVHMCVKHAYNDPEANLFIKKAGCYHFDGDMALGYARTRKQDPRGDFDRIDHQQQLIRVMLSKVTSLGLLLQPWKILGIADAVGDSLLHDEAFDVGLAYGLAGRLKGGDGVDTSRVEFRQVPSYPAYIGGISYVLPKENEAKAMFAAMQADTWPLPEYGKTAASIPVPRDVTIRVYDASGKAGVAKAIHEKLRKLGFDVKVIIKKAPSTLARTEIWFRPGDELRAKLVDESLKTDANVRAGEKTEVGSDVTIYVGADAEAEPSATPS